MCDLDEATRALLALAGDAHDPTDAERTRVRAALAARLAAPAGRGAGSTIAAATTAKAATANATGVATTAKAMAATAGGLGAAGTTSAVVTGGALATKLVVAVAITATVGVGATVKLVRRGTHGPAPAAKVEVHARRAAATTPGMPSRLVPDQPVRETPPADEPAPGLAAPRPGVPGEAPRAAPARASAEPPARGTAPS